jgi:tRNA (guanine-N7-)-methyltransferase
MSVSDSQTPGSGVSARVGVRRRLTERRWVNPYIGRLDTVREQLIGSETLELSSDERDQLTRTCSSWTSTFLELGSGSGAHLLEQAERHGDALWVGVELRFKRLVRTVEKAQKKGIQNLVVVRADGMCISELFGGESLDGVFINFPDPWDKRRWRKHRMLGEELLSQLATLLKEGGILSFKTDHRDYFDEVLSAIQRTGRFSIDITSLDLHQSPFAKDNIMSEFEQLFAAKGLPIFHLRASRR